MIVVTAPPAAPSEPVTSSITVRLTASEKRQVAVVAAARRMSVSALVRQMLRSQLL